MNFIARFALGALLVVSLSAGWTCDAFADETGPTATIVPAVGTPTKRSARPLGEQRAGNRLIPETAATEKTPTAGSVLADHPIARTTLSLGLVIGLLLGAAALAKRLQGRGLFSQLSGFGSASGASPAGILEVLGRYPIGRGQSLMLLKVDQRVLLLSQSQASGRIRGGGGGMTLLTEFTQPEEVAGLLVKAQSASGEAITSRFRTLLSKFDATMVTEASTESATLPSGRSRTSGPEGDLAELLVIDESAPVARVDSFPQPQPMAEDPIGSLRQRLTALRGEAAR